MSIAQVAKGYLREALSSGNAERFVTAKKSQILDSTFRKKRTVQVAFFLAVSTIKMALEQIPEGKIEDKEAVINAMDKEIDRRVALLKDGWVKSGRSLYSKKFRDAYEVLDFCDLVEESGVKIRRPPLNDEVTTISLPAKNYREFSTILENRELEL